MYSIVTGRDGAGGVGHSIQHRPVVRGLGVEKMFCAPCIPDALKDGLDKLHRIVRSVTTTTAHQWLMNIALSQRVCRSLATWREEVMNRVALRAGAVGLPGPLTGVRRPYMHWSAVTMLTPGICDILTALVSCHDTAVWGSSCKKCWPLRICAR